MTVAVELEGVEVFGYHGVLDTEREHGQGFLFDLRLEVPEPAADEIEHAVDYRDVAALVQRVSDGTQFQLIESLAAAVADAISAAFPVERVRVRVRKHGIPFADYSAATVTRP